VEVGNIYTFQGREKEVVILDLVMANVNFPVAPFDELRTGDKVKRLLNVAISRAKDIVIVIAHKKYFQLKYPNQFILNFIEELERLSQNLKEIILPVKKDTDEESSERMNTFNQVYPIRSPIKPRKKAEKIEDIDGQKLLRIRELALLIKELHTRVNSTAQKFNLNLPFKLTARVNEILLNFEEIVCKNEEVFKDWIEKLYFLFYEASGAKNAPPYIFKTFHLKNLMRNDKDSNFTKPVKTHWIRTNISRLRNYYRHDNYEKPEQIQRIFNHYIRKDYPTKRIDWILCQMRMLEDLVVWLKDLMELIKDKNLRLMHSAIDNVN